MLEWINQVILTLADPVLNGLLRLPVDKIGRAHV